MSIAKIIEVKGNYFEMGQSQGAQFQGIFPDIIQSLKQLAFLPYNFQKAIPTFLYKIFFQEQGKIFSRRHHTLLTGPQQKLQERWQGIAQGMKEPPSLVYGLACLEILTSEMPHIPPLACTSLALSPNMTQNGEPLLAYNHDFPESFGKHLLLRKNFPQNGYTSISITYPIMFGAIGGINEKGLAITINHAFEKKIIKDKAGLLVTSLLQDCLDTCATTREAVEKICNTPVTNGSMLTVMDASGHHEVVEVSSQKNILRENKKNHSITFNKYRIPEMESLELPLDTAGAGVLKGRLVHEATIEREKRFEEMFNEHKNLSMEDITKIFSDHKGGSGDLGTLCRHHPKTSSTLGSALFFPQQRKMKMIFGKTCSQNYQEFSLTTPT